MSQDSSEDTTGWTGEAGDRGPDRPAWPHADPRAEQPQPGQYGPPPDQSPRPQYGQPPQQYGQPPSAPSQYGQAQYEPPGPPQYGQPQYGQPQYGQPQYGGSQSGQRQPGEQQQPGRPRHGAPEGQYGGQQQYGQQYGQQQYGGQQYAPPPGQGYPPPGYQGMQGVAPAAGYGQQTSPSDDRTWGMLAYLLSFVGGLIAPLIIYFVKKDQSPFVRHHAAQSLNIQLTSLMYCFGLLIISLVAAAVSHGFGILLFFLYFPLGIVFLVYIIMAAVAANRGELYQAPGWVALQIVH